MVAGFPALDQPIETGVDGSYRYGLNRLGADDEVDGRDVVFNYGPFGYLLFPLDLGANESKALVFELAVSGLFAWALLLLARLRQDLTAPAAFVVSYALALGMGLSTEYRLLLVLVLLTCLSCVEPRGAAWAAAAGGLLSGFSVFLKFSLGAAGLAMVLLAGLAGLARRRSGGWKPALAPLAAAAVAVAGVVALHFGGLAPFLRWTRLSLEIARGYASAMSLGGSWPALLLAQGVLLVWLALLVVEVRRGSELRVVVLVLLVPLLLAYKHGFVRQATHAALFFRAALPLTAVPVLAAATPRARRAALAGLGAVALLVLAAVPATRGMAPPGFLRRATGVEGLENLLHLAAPGDRLAAVSQANLASEKLPADWLEDIETRGGTVDVVPYELSLLAANRLPWSPNPVLQTYTAYTPALDGESGRHFSEPSRPAWVILQPETIDLRHVLLDAPRTARSLLDHYRLAGFEPDPPRLLLADRRAGPAPGLVEGPSLSARLGDWIEVPPSGGPWFAALDLRLTARGRLQGLVLRRPAVAAELAYADGAVTTVRLLPETAGEGLLINVLPRTPEGFARLFEGRPREHVVRFRIGGSGALLYDERFAVRWLSRPPV